MDKYIKIIEHYRNKFATKKVIRRSIWVAGSSTRKAWYRASNRRASRCACNIRAD